MNIYYIRKVLNNNKKKITKIKQGKTQVLKKIYTHIHWRTKIKQLKGKTIFRATLKYYVQYSHSIYSHILSFKSAKKLYKKFSLNFLAIFIYEML